LNLASKLAATLGWSPHRQNASNCPALLVVARLSLGGTKSLAVIEYKSNSFLIAMNHDEINSIQAISTRPTESRSTSGPGDSIDEDL